MSADAVLIEDIVIQAKKERLALLMLDGANGTVACRIHDEKTSKTFPPLSENGTIECATRTLMRMSHLKAVRGGVRGASMIGPADYFGNLETPDQYAYSISIMEGLPRIQRHSLAEKVEPCYNQQLAQEQMTVIHATWLNGKTDKKCIEKIAEEIAKPEQSLFGDSLFPNPGLLLIEEDGPILLTPLDARGVDLSSFKARLVKNDQPFQIVNSALKSSDEFRVVSYYYQPGYAEDRIRHGGGLFLETHDFSQTMTPLDAEAGGFITLGCWDHANNQLKLIAITIPFGYTLLVDKDCIHGDTTFVGNYMMSMTSDHLTMETANTVFLKHAHTKLNVSMQLTDEISFLAQEKITPAPPPLFLFADANEKEKESFWKSARAQQRVITQPMSTRAWEYTWECTLFGKHQAPKEEKTSINNCLVC